MQHRGMIVCVVLAGLVVAAALCSAQTTQPSGQDTGAARPQPNLQPVPTEKSGTGANAPAAGAGGSAVTTPPATAPAAPAAPTSNSPLGSPWFMFVLLGGLVLMFWWSSRSRRKQQAKHKEMLSTLKKGDKVVTIGGIMGTIIEARPEEITVKVDETNNVRMKFARWAIRDSGEAVKTSTAPEEK